MTVRNTWSPQNGEAYLDTWGHWHCSNCALMCFATANLIAAIDSRGVSSAFAGESCRYVVMRSLNSCKPTLTGCNLPVSFKACNNKAALTHSAQSAGTMKRYVCEGLSSLCRQLMLLSVARTGKTAQMACYSLPRGHMGQDSDQPAQGGTSYIATTRPIMCVQNLCASRCH